MQPFYWRMSNKSKFMYWVYYGSWTRLLWYTVFLHIFYSRDNFFMVTNIRFTSVSDLWNYIYFFIYFVYKRLTLHITVLSIYSKITYIVHGIYGRQVFLEIISILRLLSILSNALNRSKCRKSTRHARN